MLGFHSKHEFSLDVRLDMRVRKERKGERKEKVGRKQKTVRSERKRQRYKTGTKEMKTEKITQRK
jgi:hypothetical protein